MSILLRGPVSCYIYHDQQNDIKYILLGDEHKSLASDCPRDCAEYSDNIIPNNKCWDITFLLYFLFQQNKEIDFYSEYPFITKGSQHVPPQIKAMSYLRKVNITFGDCFNKRNCEFPNVRFHYADIRMTPADTVNIETILLGIFSNTNNFKKQNLERFKEVNTTVEYLFREIEGRTILTHLFELALYSHNYVEDAKWYLQPLINQVNPPIKNFIESILEYPVIVQRDGMVMHRIGAQLWELEKEGTSGIKLAQMIREYSLILRSGFENSRFLFEWGSFYDELKYTLNRELNPYFVMRKLINFKNIVAFLGGIYVDAYLLGRMFRPFTPKSKVKIIFAGAFHTFNYKNFLKEKLNFTPIFEFPRDENRCIPIDFNNFL